MDRFMKKLLANRKDVVIVADSARVHYSESSEFMYADQSSTEFVPNSKADSRWKCKSQSPCTIDNTKTKDKALVQPPLRKPSRGSPKVTSTKADTKSANQLKKRSSPPPKRKSAEEIEAEKAQQIIGMVQSLAFRAATAMKNDIQQRESETIAVSME